MAGKPARDRSLRASRRREGGWSRASCRQRKYIFKHASRGNNSWKKIKARTCIRWPTRMLRMNVISLWIFPAAHGCLTLSLFLRRSESQIATRDKGMDVRLRFMILVCFSHYNVQATLELPKNWPKFTLRSLKKEIEMSIFDYRHESIHVQQPRPRISFALNQYLVLLYFEPSWTNCLFSSRSFRLCRAIIGNLWCGSKQHALIVKSELASS